MCSPFKSFSAKAKLLQAENISNEIVKYIQFLPMAIETGIILSIVERFLIKQAAIKMQ